MRNRISKSIRKDLVVKMDFFGQNLFDIYLVPGRAISGENFPKLLIIYIGT